MSANERQVGGTHYKTGYEHWDLVIKIPMGYFEGNTTKYVSRARKKGGLQDLRKAMHYLEKLIENFDELCDLIAFERLIPLKEIRKEVTNFASINNLSSAEEEYILILCTYNVEKDLQAAKSLLENIIKEAEVRAYLRPMEEPDYPGTPADGGHHTSNP